MGRPPSSGSTPSTENTFVFPTKGKTQEVPGRVVCQPVATQVCFIPLVARHESFTQAGSEQRLLGGQVSLAAPLKNE